MLEPKKPGDPIEGGDGAKTDQSTQKDSGKTTEQKGTDSPKK